MFIDCLKAFLVGGIICAIGQILVDKTKLTPARILSAYLVCGIVLTAIGLYEPVVEWAGAGASVPLSGFGYVIAKGMQKAVDERGALGILTGSLTAAAGGISAAVFFGFLAALVAKPHDKSL